MIVELLFNLITALINLLPFSLPSLPSSVSSVLSSFESYLLNGVGLVKNYTHWDYLMSLFGIVVVMEAAFYGYKFFMWITKKIPALNVK